MGGRAVDCTGLENRQARKRFGGSNPSPSAKKNSPYGLFFSAVVLHRLFPEAAIQAGVVRLEVGYDLEIVAPRLRQLDALDVDQAQQLAHRLGHPASAFVA